MLRGSQVGNTTVRELWGLEPMVWKRAYDFSFNLFVFFIPLLVIIVSYCLIHLQMIKWVPLKGLYLEIEENT
jgi:hypothetical protein